MPKALQPKAAFRVFGVLALWRAVITPHFPSPDPNQSTNRPEDRAAETRERLQPGLCHPEVEMAAGLVQGNHRFAASPVGIELAIGVVLAALILGGIAVRLFVFS